ncbi:MAG: diguanylate cyclase [Bdellovibrionales bacterium]
MDISAIRSEFMVYIVDDEASIRSILKETLGDAGYQTREFETADDAFKVVQEEPPHVILSDIRMPGMSGIDLLEAVRKLTEDIQFIIMTSHASLDTALTAIKHGAYDYLHKPFEDLGDVVVTVDRTIEKLYLQYQNEQLMEELENKNTALISLNERISKEKEEVVSLNHLMAELSQAKDINQVVDCFLLNASNILNGSPVLFFKHMTAYQSFVAANAQGIPKETLRGLGVSFKEVDQKEYLNRLARLNESVEVSEMVQQVFGKTEFLLSSVYIENQLHGFFLVLNPIHDLAQRRLYDSFVNVMQAFYHNAEMKKRIHDMAIKDPLTGLYNRRFFNQRMEEEIARSRRSKYPVSLVYLDIDHFKKYNDQNGHQMGDVLLKQISALMKKSTRKSDLVARMGGEEFCFILPHTDGQGAAIKAEKIRRIVEKTPFPNAEKQPMGFVSISLGVSEYPSSSHDVESLVKAADDALYQVKETTRNKVCLAAAPEGFTKDFEPRPIPKREES